MPDVLGGLSWACIMPRYFCSCTCGKGVVSIENADVTPVLIYLCLVAKQSNGLKIFTKCWLYCFLIMNSWILQRECRYEYQYLHISKMSLALWQEANSERLNEISKLRNDLKVNNCVERTGADLDRQRSWGLQKLEWPSREIVSWERVWVLISLQWPATDGGCPWQKWCDLEQAKNLVIAKSYSWRELTAEISLLETFSGARELSFLALKGSQFSQTPSMHC